MFDIGPVELIFILLIVTLIFGPRRISQVAGELGKAIRAFREGLKGQTGSIRGNQQGEEAEVRKEVRKKDTAS